MLDGLELPRARDEATQRVASSWHIRCPIEGIWHPQASYLSPEWEVFVLPLRVGWHQPSGFSMRIIQERRVKPPDQDLMGGGGALAPV
jgi:hypothetical protein